MTIAHGFPGRNHSIIRATETVRFVVLDSLDVIRLHSGVLPTSKDKKSGNEACPRLKQFIFSERCEMTPRQGSRVIHQQLQNVTGWAGRQGGLKNQVKPDVDDGSKEFQEVDVQAFALHIKRFSLEATQLLHGKTKINKILMHDSPHDAVVGDHPPMPA